MVRFLSKTSSAVMLSQHRFGGVALGGARRALSSQTFAETAPMLVVHAKLRASTQAVLPVAALQDMIASSGAGNADTAIGALVDAGCVVPIDDGAFYHVRPSQLLADMESVGAGDGPSSGTEAAPTSNISHVNVVRSAQERHDAAVKQYQAVLATLDDAIQKASRWRKTIWGGAMLFSGAQLAIISRLTYVDLDWDVMEPVSYFLGTGTSLAFFAYVLKYHRDHSYDDFDKTMLPKQLRRFAPKDFDWAAYELAVEAVKTTADELERAKQWAQHN